MTALSIRDQDFSLTASAVRTIAVQGNYLRYVRESTGAVDPTLTIKLPGGAEVSLLPGEDIAVDGGFVDEVLIANKTGVTLTGVLQIGVGKISSTRVVASVTINGGTVNIGTMPTVNVANELHAIVAAGNAYQRNATVLLATPAPVQSLSARPALTCGWQALPACRASKLPASRS